MRKCPNRGEGLIPIQTFLWKSWQFIKRGGFLRSVPSILKPILHQIYHKKCFLQVFLFYFILNMRGHSKFFFTNIYFLKHKVWLSNIFLKNTTFEGRGQYWNPTFSAKILSTRAGEGVEVKPDWETFPYNGVFVYVIFHSIFSTWYNFLVFW